MAEGIHSSDWSNKGRIPPGRSYKDLLEAVVEGIQEGAAEEGRSEKSMEEEEGRWRNNSLEEGHIGNLAEAARGAPEALFSRGSYPEGGQRAGGESKSGSDSNLPGQKDPRAQP